MIDENDYIAERDIPENQRLLAECLLNRQNAYIDELGSWQQQLDMIYHDIDEWKSKVTEIKTRYPKP